MSKPNRMSMMRVIAAILTLSLLATPKASIAADEDDAVPSWVPWTVGGVMIAGGLLFLIRQCEGDRYQAKKTPRQHALDMIAYVSNREERAELESLESKDDVQAFLSRFFLAHDPTPATSENEFREELIRRFRFANRNLGDHGEGWKSDAGRVYILYGPPETVLRSPSIETQTRALVQWKSAEFWEYESRPGGNPFPSIFQDQALFDEIFHVTPPSRGRMLFVFARMTMGAPLVQVYSTEPGEVIDPGLLP